ncbi:MAG TPA: hypothetical protein VKT25_02825 [Ktedonobacteraceae bacterium]|nr:hypothetical protein [Ktedonobacteraceae bacterium]
MDTADTANTTSTGDTPETLGPIGHVDTNDPTSYTLVSGVYREREQAEQGVKALKQAGFSEIQFNEYNPNPLEEANDGIVRESHQRFVVSVEAAGRQQEAVGILMSRGSNNADLPPGTDLLHGNIVSENASTTDVAEKTAAGTNADSFYQGAKPLSHSDELNVKDNSNFPRS